MATQTADDDKKRMAMAMALLGLQGPASVDPATSSGGLNLDALVNNAASQGAGQLLGAKAKQVEGEAGTRHITNVSADVQNPFQSGFFQSAPERLAAMQQHTGAYERGPIGQVIPNSMFDQLVARATPAAAAPGGVVRPPVTGAAQLPSEVTPIGPAPALAPPQIKIPLSSGVPFINPLVPQAPAQNTYEDFFHPAALVRRKLMGR